MRSILGGTVDEIDDGTEHEVLLRNKRKGESPAPMPVHRAIAASCIEARKSKGIRKSGSKNSNAIYDIHAMPMSALKTIKRFCTP